LTTQTKTFHAFRKVVSRFYKGTETVQVTPLRTLVSSP